MSTGSRSAPYCVPLSIACAMFVVLAVVDDFGSAMLRLAIIAGGAIVGFLLSEGIGSARGIVATGIIILIYDLIVNGPLAVVSGVFCIAITSWVVMIINAGEHSSHNNNNTPKAIPVKIVNTNKRRGRDRRRRSTY